MLNSEQGRQWNQYVNRPDLADRDVAVEMARQAGDSGNDDEYCRLLSRELD